MPDSGAGRSLKSIDRATVATLVVAMAATLAWLSGRHMPLGLHFEDIVKVRAVLTAANSFQHPLLMIHLARLANAVLGLADPQAVIELGRACAAFVGGLAIVATFALARCVLPPWAAFTCAVVAGVEALVGVHARYFKEDIFIVPFVEFGLAALIAALRRPSAASLIALGAAIGLAGGAKYVAGALLLPYALIVLIGFGARPRLGERLIDAAVVALAAVLVFAVIEIPAWLAWPRFAAGVKVALTQAVHGRYDIVLPITTTWGLFHLRESLWPALGPLLTILGVLGLAAPFVAAGGRRQALAAIAGFTLLWYLAHEVSPFKAFPDFARYMVPIAPLLVVLAAALVHECAERYWRRRATILTIVVVLIAAAPAAWTTYRINAGAADDPRRLLPDILASAPGRVVPDGYAGYRRVPFVVEAATLPDAAVAAILVTSSFNYDRYLRYGTLPGQPPRTRDVAAYFARVLALPRLDVSNGAPAYGFYNPTTTIIALDGDAERLRPIANKIATVAPSLRVQWRNTPSR